MRFHLENVTLFSCTLWHNSFENKEDELDLMKFKDDAAINLEKISMSLSSDISMKRATFSFYIYFIFAFGGFENVGNERASLLCCGPLKILNIFIILFLCNISLNFLKWVLSMCMRSVDLPLLSKSSTLEKCVHCVTDLVSWHYIDEIDVISKFSYFPLFARWKKDVLKILMISQFFIVKREMRDERVLTRPNSEVAKSNNNLTTHSLLSLTFSFTWQRRLNETTLRTRAMTTKSENNFLISTEQSESSFFEK